MVRYLDISGINPVTKNPWLNTPSTVFNGLSLTLEWPNKQLDENPDEETKCVCLHWTAGSYTDVYNDYNFNIVWDRVKKIAYVIKTFAWHEKPSHLWKRNSYTVGITLCSKTDNGLNEPTPGQIALAAQVTAEVCAWKNIDPRSKVSVPEWQANSDASTMVLTGRNIPVPAVFDHAGFAGTDNYSKWRWDCRSKVLNGQTLYASYLEQVIKYYDLLKLPKGNPLKKEFEFKELLV